MVKVAGKGVKLKTVLLHQEFSEELNQNNTLFEELLSVFKQELDAFNEKKILEGRLANDTLKVESTRELLDEIGRLEKLMGQVNIFALKGKVEKVMNTMGYDLTNC